MLLKFLTANFLEITDFVLISLIDKFSIKFISLFISDILNVYPVFSRTSSAPPFLKLITKFPEDKASNTVNGRLSIKDVQIYISDKEYISGVSLYGKKSKCL